MGINTTLISETTKDFAVDFICSVCTELVEHPITLVKCQHSFCHTCINGVIAAAGGIEATSCPDCRKPFEPTDLVEPYRIMKQVMSRIQLACPYPECNYIVTYDNFTRHLEKCDSAPSAIEACEYCSAGYHRNNHEQHQWECIPLLQSRVMELSSKLVKVEKSELKFKSELATKSSPIIQLPTGIKLTSSADKERTFVATLRIATPEIFDNSGRDEGFIRYQCNSSAIAIEGGLIKIKHEFCKYDTLRAASSDTATSTRYRNFFGLEMTKHETVKQIDAEFKMKIWKNGNQFADSVITTGYGTSVTFTDDSKFCGYNLNEKHIGNLAPEVTCQVRIKKWNITKKTAKEMQEISQVKRKV